MAEPSASATAASSVELMGLSLGALSVAEMASG